MIAHVFGGFIAGYAASEAPAATLALTWLFFKYEIVEKRAVKDACYPELREFLLGLTLGVIASFLYII